ncbi:glycosyltransferase [bacterium]|nr:MAG: glycosyltransferase [bacterium]
MIKENTVTIVIPSFNEEKNINELLKRLFQITSKLDNFEWFYLFVDDCSQDRTFDKLKEKAVNNKNIKIIRLSRNFGSHIAISAGIENSNSDAVIVISSDLQEPPELIEKLIKEWGLGYQVVWAVRKHRAQSLLGKICSKIYSKLFRYFSGLINYPEQGASGYFLIDKKVAKLWPKFKETNRVVGGMLAWLGFKQTVIQYEQSERYAGKSSFTFMKLVKLAIDAFVSFSYMPIRFIFYLGILVSFVGFFYAIYLILNKIIYGIGPTGWTSVMVIVLFLGGIQLISLGILGEYIWRGVEESRRRPLYVIMEKVNFDEND